MVHTMFALSLIHAAIVSMGASQGQGNSSRVAVQLYVFGKPAQKVAEPLDGVLATAKHAGYNTVQAWLRYYESPESADRLVKMLAKHGLTMPIAYTGGAMHVQDRADKAIAEILRLARIGAKHGLKIVAMNPDPLKREKTDAELAVQSRNLNALGGALRKLGLKLAIHQHAPEMRSGAREWYHILRNTDADKVFFCLDIDWVHHGGQDPYKLLRDAAKPKRIADLHLRSSRNKVWLERLDEGDVDFRRVAKILKECGYDGYYTVELAYRKDTKRTRSLEENLRLSRAYVREVFGL